MLFPKALKINPGNERVLYVASRVYLGLKKITKAERYINEAIRIAPENADFFAVKSMVYAAKFHWKTAEKWARRGLSIDPDNEYCRNLLGFVSRQNEDSSLKKEDLEETLRKNPQNSYAHSNLGWFKAQTNLNEAKEHFLEALRLEPRNHGARKGFLFVTKNDNRFFRFFQHFINSIREDKYVIPRIIFVLIYLGVTTPFMMGLAVCFGMAFSIIEIPSNYYFLVTIPYLIFFFLTNFHKSFTDPISVLLLRNNPLTNSIIPKPEKTGSNIVLTFLSIGLLIIALFIFFRTHLLMYLSIWFLLYLPIFNWAFSYPIWFGNFKRLIIYAVLVGLTGLAAVYSLIINPQEAYKFLFFFGIGILMFKVVLNSVFNPE